MPTAQETVLYVNPQHPDSTTHEDRFIQLEQEAYNDYTEQSSYSKEMPSFSVFFATYLKTHS